MSAGPWWLDAAGRSLAPPADPTADPVWRGGEGLIETMRATLAGGVAQVPLLARHAARLRAAAGQVGLPAPGEGLFAALPELAAAAGESTALRLRLCWGAGVAGDGLGVVTAAALPPADDAPVRLAPVPARRDLADPTCTLKTTSRMFWRVAQRQAVAAGADQALVCASHGGIAESTWCNLFLRTPAGELVTPVADGSLLPGVARAALLDAARAAGVVVRERRVELAELRSPGSGLAVTNAVRGPRPAVLVDPARPESERRAAPARAEPVATLGRLWRQVAGAGG